MENIDADVLFRKIQIIEDNLKKLYELKKFSLENFSSDFRNIESVKHLLQISIEALIDISTHIVARGRMHTPYSSVDAIRLMAENEIIPKEHEKKFAQMVRFRNRIVHFYQKIDEDELYKILQDDLPDFKTFVKDVTNHLNTAP